MGRILVFANQKGGVGKTTSAASLGILGYRTLLVDMDPQGSATGGVGVAKKSLRYTVRDLLAGGCRAKEAILATSFQNLSLIPANATLAGAEFDLLGVEEGVGATLAEALGSVRSDYDYILIDCPPSLGRRNHPFAVRVLCSGRAHTADIDCRARQKAV